MIVESPNHEEDFNQAITMGLCVEAWLQTKGLTLQGLALDFTLEEATLILRGAHEDLGMKVTERGSLAFKDGYSPETLSEPVLKAISTMAKQRRAGVEAALDQPDSFRLPIPVTLPANQRSRSA